MAPEPRHAQCVHHKAGLHVRLHAPAHYLAAEQIDHADQKQPAFCGSDVDDVAAPNAIWSARREVPGQQVLRIGFSNALFPSPRHPEHGRTGSEHSAPTRLNLSLDAG